jgi:hypothetical protein
MGTRHFRNLGIWRHGLLSIFFNIFFAIFQLPISDFQVRILFRSITNESIRILIIFYIRNGAICCLQEWKTAATLRVRMFFLALALFFCITLTYSVHGLLSFNTMIDINHDWTVFVRPLHMVFFHCLELEIDLFLS